MHMGDVAIRRANYMLSVSVWCIFRGAKAVRGGGVCCDAAAPPQCVFGLEAAATGFPLGMRIPCTIVCKSSADDVGRIGFVREPADGESPHRWPGAWSLPAKAVR